MQLWAYVKTSASIQLPYYFTGVDRIWVFETTLEGFNDAVTVLFVDGECIYKLNFNERTQLVYCSCRAFYPLHTKWLEIRLHIKFPDSCNLPNREHLGW
jgi:hypothetical protein